MDLDGDGIWELIIDLTEENTAEKKTIYEEIIIDDIPAFFMETTKSKLCLGLYGKLFDF
jgi:hypothetical protein